jgi:hypothetical protein
MEASQLQFLAGLATTITYAGMKGYGICKSNYKSRVFGLLVSNTEGLKEVIDELEIDTEKVQPLIVNNSLEGYLDKGKYETLEKHRLSKSPYYSILLFKYFNEFLKELKKANKQTVYVVITDSHKLLKDLKVKREQISLLLPNAKYYFKLIGDLENEKAKEVDMNNREELIYLTYPKFYFGSKSQLVNIFSKLFTKGQDVSNYA